MAVMLLLGLFLLLLVMVDFTGIDAQEYRNKQAEVIAGQMAAKHGATVARCSAIGCPAGVVPLDMTRVSDTLGNGDAYATGQFVSRSDGTSVVTLYVGTREDLRGQIAKALSSRFPELDSVGSYEATAQRIVSNVDGGVTPLPANFGGGNIVTGTPVVATVF